jgi:nucleoid DNA-binding protein
MVNKHAIIERLKESLGFKYQNKELLDIIEKYNAVVLDAVANGEEAYVSSFGKFYIKVSKPRTIKNAGIPWLQGKNFSSKEKFKIGFRPSSSANKLVAKLHAEMVEHAKKQY